MGVVEDVPGELEDFAPEPRTFHSRLEALEARLEKLENRLEDFEKAIDRRYELGEQSQKRRHDETISAIRALIDYNKLNQRLLELEDAMSAPAPKSKGPMDRPDSRGEIGPFCPDCERKHGIKTRLTAREKQGTGKLYFGCPNFDPPYRCRFHGCRDGL